MKIYHGTIKQNAENIINNGILLSKSKESLDFGKGFYTAPDVNFAISTAYGKNKKANKNRSLDRFAGAILEFDFDINKVNDIKHLSFENIDIDWAQFIINNRNGYAYTDYLKSKFHNLDSKYDIVTGAIADNRIVPLSKYLKVLNEPIKKSELNDIIYDYETEQISFHTLKSLDCISFSRYGIINMQKGVEWYE